MTFSVKNNLEKARTSATPVVSMMSNSGRVSRAALGCLLKQGVQITLRSAADTSRSKVEHLFDHYLASITRTNDTRFKAKLKSMLVKAYHDPFTVSEAKL